MSRFNVAPEKALSDEEKRRVYGIFPAALLQKLMAAIAVINARLVEPHLEALEAKVAELPVDAEEVAGAVCAWLAGNRGFIDTVVDAVVERLPAPPPPAEVMVVEAPKEAPDPFGDLLAEIKTEEAPKEAPAPAAVVIEAPAEPAPAEETATAAEAAPPAISSIFDLAQRAKENKEEWGQKKNSAREALFHALGALKLRLDPEAICQDRGSTAMHFLTVKIASGEMTVEQAVEFAKSQDGWLIEMAVAPSIYNKMMDGFTAAGLHLRRNVKVGVDVVDVHTEFGQALEKGEATLEEIIRRAREAGWTLPFREDSGTSVGEMLAYKANGGPEEEERRNSGGKRRRERGRTNEGSRKV